MARESWRGSEGCVMSTGLGAGALESGVSDGSMIVVVRAVGAKGSKWSGKQMEDRLITKGVDGEGSVEENELLWCVVVLLCCCCCVVVVVLLCCCGIVLFCCCVAVVAVLVW